MTGFFFGIRCKRHETSKASFHYDPPMRQKPSSTGPARVLETVPADLVAEMLDAVKKARFDIVVKLIDRVGTYNEDLARSLSVMAKNYDYESILELLGQGE